MLIQPYFNYGCCSWFPLLKKKLKIRLQKAQNNCNCFYLNLPLSSHTDPLDFRIINWFLASDRSEYYIVNTFFHYWSRIVLRHKMFKSSLCRYSTRSQMALHIPCGKLIQGKKDYPS